MLRTKRVRLTRSLFLDGHHVEEGSIRDLALPVADELVAQRSAVRLNPLSSFFAGIRSFLASRSKREERTRVAVSKTFPLEEIAMDANEKAKELIERAKKLGLRLEFDTGLIVAKSTGSGDPTAQDDIIAELGKYIHEVRRLVARRAMAVRAKEFLGQRIWSEEGEGVLASASGDGDFSISLERDGSRHSHTVSVRAESMLIVLSKGSESL